MKDPKYFKTYETFTPRKIEDRKKTEIGQKIEQERIDLENKISALKKHHIYEVTRDIVGWPYKLSSSEFEFEFPIGTELEILDIIKLEGEYGVIAKVYDEFEARTLDLDENAEWYFYPEDFVKYTIAS